MVHWTNKPTVAFLVTHAANYRQEVGTAKKNEYTKNHLKEEVHRLLGRTYDDIEKKVHNWYGNYYQTHKEDGQPKIRQRKAGKKGKWTFRKVVTRVFEDDIRAEREFLVKKSKDKGEQKGYLAYVQVAISNVAKEIRADVERKKEIEEKVAKWNEKPPLKILIENANHPSKGVLTRLHKDTDALNEDMGCKTFTLAWYLDKDRKPKVVYHETGKGTGNSFTENVPDWMTNPEWTKAFKKHWNRVHKEEMKKRAEQGEEDDEDEDDEVRADFAITFSEDGKTLTFLPPLEDFRLPALKNGVRLILNTIFGAFAGDKSLRCPWLSLGDNMEMFFEPGSVPENTTFRDPSKMKMEELAPIYSFWYEKFQEKKLNIRFRPEAFKKHVVVEEEEIQEEEEEIQYPSDDEEDEEQEDEPVEVQPKKRKSGKDVNGKGKAKATQIQEEDIAPEPQDDEEPGESLLDDPKDDDGMVSAMTTDPKDVELQKYLLTLKPYERAYTTLIEKVFNIPEIGLNDRRMPGGRSVPKWLDLTKRLDYLPKEVHELRAYTSFMGWAKEDYFTGVTGALVVKELLLQLCLGIGLLLREISFINDTEEGEFPEEAPLYLRDSRLDMSKYEEVKMLIYHVIYVLKDLRAEWLIRARASVSATPGASDALKSNSADNQPEKESDAENTPEKEPTKDVDMEGAGEIEEDPAPSQKKSKGGKKSGKVAEGESPSAKKRKEMEGAEAEEGGSVPKRKKTVNAASRLGTKKATEVNKMKTRSAASGSKPATRSSKRGGA